MYTVNICGEKVDLTQLTTPGQSSWFPDTALTKYGPIDPKTIKTTRFSTYYNKPYDQLTTHEICVVQDRGFKLTLCELCNILMKKISELESFKQSYGKVQERSIQFQTLANENEAKFNIEIARRIAAEALCLELQSKVEQLTPFQEEANLLKLALALSEDKVTTLATENLRREQERQMLEDKISELNNRINVLQKDHKVEMKKLREKHEVNVTSEVKDIKAMLQNMLAGYSDSEISRES